MNLLQKTAFTYVSIYVICMPFHLPDRLVIPVALIATLGVFINEGGLTAIAKGIKKLFRINGA
jgi:hypothetical protein